MKAATAAVAVACAAIAAGPVAGIFAAGVRAGTAARLPSASSVPAVPAGAVGRTLLLITGDRFAVIPGTGGARQGTVLGRLPGSPAGGMASLSLAGAVYEIPYNALPYLGRGLDPNLFKLSALLGAEQGGRLPVVVSFRGHRPALPGITITGTVGLTASGYLTASSARSFGVALARQFIADHGTAGYGTDGLFGQGVSVSLAGISTAAARLTERQGAASGGPFELHTLTIGGTDLAGQPDTGDGVIVINIDDPGRFSDLGAVSQSFFHGLAKFSVPAGHYFALGFFTDISGGNPTAVRLTVLPQFTVSRDVTVTTAAGAADSEIMMVTPQPAIAPAGSTFQIIRGPAVGPPIGLQLQSELPIWISPTSERPTVGRLATVTSEVLFSPAGARASYQYDLSYQDLSGLIHRQRFLIRPGGLATISARYYSAAALRGAFVLFGWYPIESGTGNFPGVTDISDFGLPSRPPLLHITAGPSLSWSGALARLVPGSGGFFFFYQQADLRTYRAGQRVTQDWNRYPLHPAPDVNVPGLAAALGLPLVASATRAGNVLTMFVTPFSDNLPGHLGTGIVREPGVRFAGRYEVDQNGAKMAAGDATSSFFWQARLSHKPSVIRFTLDASRSGKPYPLSARSRTVWTWRSAPDPGATVPSPWICGAALTDDFTRRCSAQPLLALEYSVSWLRLDGSAAPGKQALTVSVGHFQPSASTAKITSVRVQVSFDNGRTWQAASVAACGTGRFLASYTAPKWARYAELRVTASDATGSTVSETLPHAYRIAS